MSPPSLSRDARADLRSIWRYSRDRWNVAQADRYVATIVAIIAALADMPGGGRRCDDIRPGYRRFRSGSHLIFYRAGPDGIDIVRILHESMDAKRHL